MTSPHNDRAAKIAAAAPRNRRNLTPIIGIIVAILVVAGIIFAVTRPSDSGPSTLATGGTSSSGATSDASSNAGSSSSTSGASSAATSGGIKLPKTATSATAPIIGSAGGTDKSGVPTLTIFEDFQCPACKQTEDAFGERIRSLGNDGKINVHYYVLQFLDRNLKNDSSTRAAQAALCAADAGKFDEFHDKLYKKQPKNEGDGYSDDVLKATAQEAGITGAALDTWNGCYAAKTYVPYLQSIDDWTFNTAKIDGTPKFFVNNKLFTVNPTWSADEFEKALNDAAAK